VREVSGVGLEGIGATRPGIPMAEYGAAGLAFPAGVTTSGRAFWAPSEIHPLAAAFAPVDAPHTAPRGRWKQQIGPD
jgi:hypothetical protein